MSSGRSLNSLPPGLLTKIVGNCEQPSLLALLTTCKVVYKVSIKRLCELLATVPDIMFRICSRCGSEATAKLALRAVCAVRQWKTEAQTWLTYNQYLEEFWITPFHLAVANPNFGLEVIDFFLENEFPTGRLGEIGSRSVLESAVLSKRYEIVKRLTERTRSTEYYEECLYLSIVVDSEELVAFFLSLGCCGSTALERRRVPQLRITDTMIEFLRTHGLTVPEESLSTDTFNPGYPEPPLKEHRDHLPFHRHCSHCGDVTRLHIQPEDKPRLDQLIGTRTLPHTQNHISNEETPGDLFRCFLKEPETMLADLQGDSLQAFIQQQMQALEYDIDFDPTRLHYVLKDMPKFLVAYKCLLDHDLYKPSATNTFLDRLMTGLLNGGYELDYYGVKSLLLRQPFPIRDSEPYFPLSHDLFTTQIRL